MVGIITPIKEATGRLVQWDNMKMKRNPNCECKVCKKSIYRRPFQVTGGSVYCSRQCTGIDQQKTKVCKICKSPYLGNKVTCSRSCANKARSGIRYTKEGKFDKAYKGKALKEKIAKTRNGICERCCNNNYAILQIHHVTERHKGGTDDLDNLELLCPNCHMTHHHGYALYED